MHLPPAVLHERRVGEELPGSAELRVALASGWLSVRQVQNQLLVQALQRDLDRGEAEAIALALQEQPDWTLLDERDARNVAKSYGLKVTGLLGVLVRAKRDGMLESLSDALRELRDKAGFYLRADLVTSILI